MMKIYLAGISTQYEGEDIEVRYRIYENEELVCKESIMLEYKKPAVVGQVALTRLLKDLEKHMGKEMTIIINDPSLNEIIRGTSTTKNRDALKMAKVTRDALSKFGSSVTVKDVTGNREELARWNEVLQP